MGMDMGMNNVLARLVVYRGGGANGVTYLV